MPFAIILVGLTIELTPAHFLYTGPLLTAMPALASLTMGRTGILTAAALAFSVTAISATMHGSWGEGQAASNALGIIVVTSASVVTSDAVHSRRQSELNQVRRIAVAAQEVILRPVPARLDSVQAASMYLAAEAGAQIGGDLYEAVPTRYGVRMIVGDVRGKGLPAVRAAAVVLGAFREAVHYEDELVEVMNHCAAALRREGVVADFAGPDGGCEDPADDLLESEAESFVTALLAQVPDSHEVLVVNRGHTPPLRLHQGRAEELVPVSPLPPLGLDEFITGPPAEAESYVFEPGDRLLLHTDGVVEARDADGRFFPLPEAAESAPAGCTPSEFLEALHLGLIRHTDGRLADDVAMLVVDRLDETADRPP
ncbi:PP2C family protein-serine/threonine phosphatase [Streptomyces sp. HNM0663]|uniref:PP2C family protein-serine/threonine phosphatase n=1 Tax=Streptomyces chengmaiensis TaxID=3040919 RepID=A0ABT6HGJ4_9ACTN|nr:PP2C family protein-serine/threonine phosphatase [Streptomyces chengmaiensis]MDH2387882.1 PP2C family protein-serine/threonine phosphatase [Streptomyces chengmaiensis]